ncbi:hypothetical protein [Magnetospirillum moscoviense]|uniref:hypothetical protein n=1 Tax=Magnetospirillum moscoviense TaxID=1437059 RepID=UPI000ABD456E|nr:hypothetical protein [Magnetospirillum moscoviense]MBF0326500.1 hypothetical protein [Alphaproteobacteria bacterium]
MREIDTSSAALRAANAFARTAALAPEASPIRPADPARPRFEVGGRAAQTDPQTIRPASGQPAANDDLPADQGGVTARQGSREQGGLIGALTAFVAKVLGQRGESEGALASSRLAGQRAYDVATGRAKPNTAAIAPEVMTPSLPTLSSGRVLDLSV